MKYEFNLILDRAPEDIISEALTMQGVPHVVHLEPLIEIEINQVFYTIEIIPWDNLLRLRVSTLQS